MHGWSRFPLAHFVFWTPQETAIREGLRSLDDKLEVFRRENLVRHVSLNPTQRLFTRLALYSVRFSILRQKRMHLCFRKSLLTVSLLR